MVKRENKAVVLIVICVTTVVLTLIGSWTYIERQQLTQQESEFQRQQEADKKKQEDSLKRLKFQECEARQRAQSESSIHIGENCELKL